MSARGGRATGDLLRKCLTPAVVRDDERGWADGDEADRIAEIDAMEADRKARWAAMPLPSKDGAK